MQYYKQTLNYAYQTKQPDLYIFYSCILLEDIPASKKHIINCLIQHGDMWHIQMRYGSLRNKTT